MKAFIMSSGFISNFLLLVLAGSFAFLASGLNPQSVIAADKSEVSGPVLRNLIVGLPAGFDPAPNYPDTIDSNDAHQLTDGIYSSGINRTIEGIGSTSMWGQKSTVGWQHTVPITIGFDLGRSRRIGGISVSSAAGAAGVYWPRSIALMVSEDKQHWRFAGELMSLSRDNGLPQIQGYTTHRFVANNLHERGRYLSLVVAVSGTPFFFTDEIEVYEDTSGEAPKVAGPQFDSMADARKFVMDNATRFGVQGRMARDFSAIRDELKAAKMAVALRRELNTRLEAAAAQIDTVAVPEAAKFKAVMPINEPHAQMLKIHAAVLSSRGLPDFFVWKNHRYDYVEWLSAPTGKLKTPQLTVSLLKDEERGDTFWIGNATQQDRMVKITVSAPAGAQPGWLRLYYVPWVDTAQSAPMPCALVPLSNEQGVWSFNLPAGLTCKIWCQFVGTALAVGEHRATLTVDAAGKSLRVPIRASVREIPQTLADISNERLGLHMFDYTERNGAYGVKPTNLKAVVALARQYGVTVPEAGPAVLPAPQAADFDADDRLVKPLDFTAFDEWVARWPGAPGYSVFINKQEKQFAGAPMGTPAFEARVGAWGRAMLEHTRSLKLRPEQLTLLIFDEPRNNEDDAIASAWMAAFKKGAPELRIYSDPMWPDPRKSEHPEAFTLPDILCPNMQMFLRNKQSSEEFYLRRQAAGQTLWFYQCTKEARLGDPTRYFRSLSWWAFRYGAKSVLYWSLGDTGNAVSSWNEYTGGRGLAYTPAFLDDYSAIGSVQFEAIRDGVQDYRTFNLLQQAAVRSHNADLKAEAQRLLSVESLEAVCASDGVDYAWKTSTNHVAPDNLHERALELLARLGKERG